MPTRTPPASLGLVAFSFARRSDQQEPNPCNQRLAENVLQIIEKETRPVTVTAQWEVAKALENLGYTVTQVVNLPEDGSYLGSEEVWQAAKARFVDLNVTEVIPVAQPFLQLTKVKRLILKDGYMLTNYPIRKIGFDPAKENTQWWTKGPLRLFLYAALQLLHH